MQFNWSPWTFVLFLLIASAALFLAWRRGSSILKDKSSDPDQLRNRLFIPLLILILVVALIQLLSVFFRR